MANKVEDNAEAHRELLLSIQHLDYAPPTYAQVQKQLGITQNELDKERQNVNELEQSTKREFKDWKDIQQRTTKRLWVKVKHPSSHKEILGGREEKEEKEYMEALEREQSCKNRIQQLLAQVADLRQQMEDLEPMVKEHDRLRRQLEDLYKRVFDGPTPAYPEEDEYERKFKSTREEFNKLQSELTNEKRAQQLLSGALSRMQTALMECERAQSYSQWDMWGGGTMADMMERSALANSQRAADQARMMLLQARRLQPAIADVGPVNMPSGSLMSDVFFDNIFTDYAFHQRIVQARNSLAIANSQMRKVASQSVAHAEWLQSQVATKGRELERAREKLETTRRDIMWRAGGLPPPQYSADPSRGETAYRSEPPPPADQGEVSMPVAQPAPNLSAPPPTAPA